MKMPRDLMVFRRRIVASAACLIVLCVAACMATLAVPLADADMMAQRRTLENLSNQPFDAVGNEISGDEGRTSSVAIVENVASWCRVAVDESGELLAIDRGGTPRDDDMSKSDYARLVQLRDKAGSEVFSSDGREWIGLWQPLGVQDGALTVSGEDVAAIDTSSTEGRVYTFLDVTSHGEFVASLIGGCVVCGGVMVLGATAVVALAVTRALRPVAESRERGREFVLSASHELKTPLMAITSACDVLEAEVARSAVSRDETAAYGTCDLADGLARWIVVIREATDEMARSVSSMLRDLKDEE